MPKVSDMHLKLRNMCLFVLLFCGLNVMNHAIASEQKGTINTNEFKENRIKDTALNKSYFDENPETQTGVSKKIVIATSFTLLQDIAQNIVKDKGEVVSITKHGAEIHDYEPTPRDIQKIQGANLIIYNGLNLEAWFDKFYQDLEDTPKLIATHNIEPIYLNDESNQLTNIPNPHAWMSPVNALIYIENIKNAIIAIDPMNKDYYEANAESYSKEIIRLFTEFQARIEEAELLPHQKWLVTSEGAFSYLARDFGLKEAYIYSINAEGQIKPKQLKNLIDLVKQHNIPVVFSETTTSDRPAKTIAQETKARYGGQLYVDSLSEPEGDVPTYLMLLETTLERIALGFETLE